MNTLEIDTFTRQLARFTDKALTLAQAEQAADRLAIRDRESDDRRSCLECSYLLLIRPCEVSSCIANTTILEVADHALRVLLQHRHVLVGRLA